MTTPIRRQYIKIKKRYPQAIVFFRLGDFYETFDEDARITSRELEITLTSRGMGKGLRVPMAGIPYHALDSYLVKLINKGHKVAICEQLSAAGSTKGLVERDVVRVVTPGTVVEPELLEGKSNNYLCSVVIDGSEAGLAYVDITTGEFAVTRLGVANLFTELERLHPPEILVPQNAHYHSDLSAFSLTRIEDVWFDLEMAREALLKNFGVLTLESYGCEQLPLTIRAAGAVIHYLGETQNGILGQLTSLTTYSTDSFMTLDVQTRRNLELFEGGRLRTFAGSLLSIIDLTKTTMGGRLLKKWLGQPLLNVEKLSRRQDVIEWFKDNTICRTEVISILTQISDMERLVNRIRGGFASPKELVALRYSLEKVPLLKEAMAGDKSDAGCDWLVEKLEPCDDIVTLIRQAIVDDPPAVLDKSNVVREGFSPELDKFRSTSKDAKQYLASLEQRERERTGIKSLKVGYNKVFGYYIEVTKSNLSQAPSDYIRKQTLVNGERFFTTELKEYESLILNARDGINELERGIFKQVCQQVGAFSERILFTASVIAELDVFSALAEVAVRYNYVRPTLTEGDSILIKEGRHPVVEQSLAAGSFVPNDAYLSNSDTQLIILTGPNMSGKSTYLKQVALTVLLAQTGSFVPAESAKIGLVDRIFTRIGAQEDLAAGQSTFMVEMVETANILNNSTPRSLIILDEIGRGTSTYDGISIARAVAEYIHNHPRLGGKTLFATHYHELVDMANTLPRVKNFNVAVMDEGKEVVFLRKIIPGGVDKSYGIHVAQLAGLPRSVINRAQEVLGSLEDGYRHDDKIAKGSSSGSVSQQLPLWQQDLSPLIEELSLLDVDSLSPLEAINKLYELKKKAEDESSER